MSKGQITVESASSSLRATLSRALATALITGIDQARENGHPLTQMQEIDLATMAAMAYHDGVVEGAEAIAGDALIAAVREAGR